MCGIAGIVGLNGADLVSRDDLDRMSQALEQRGPDDAGVWESEVVGLVHRRLAIIDPSERGSQPFSTPDGRYVIVFNGAIYNYKLLRRELELLGYKFSSTSDTEVLLWGYVHFGTDIVQHLSGMFAFALWDSVDGVLFLARDRLGEKPLYWYRDHSRFVFASEVQPILECAFFRPAASLASIHEYLSFQSTVATRSAFAGVQKLEAGSSLCLRTDDRGVLRVEEPTRYWSLLPAAVGADSEGDLAEQALCRLRGAVKSRTQADVQVGAFLSGGIDSSLVVALMSEQLGPTFPCFTLGFEDADFDESQQAQQFAASLGLRCEREMVGEFSPDMFSEIMSRYGEPFADSSAIPTYYLSRLASQEVKVVLTGDGGDEVFMGYPRYLTCQRIDVLKHLPIPVARVLARGFDSIHPVVGARAGRWAKLLQDCTLPESQRYAYMVAYFTDADKGLLYEGEMRALLDRSAFEVLSSYFEEEADLASGANRSDLFRYLPDDLLVKTDRASMSHGVEARAPFLEHQLVEWALALPTHAKMHSHTPKALLRDAARGLLPAAILDRAKRGFQCPMGAWLRGSLEPLLRDTLSSRQFRNRGLFDQSQVVQLMDEHQSKLRNNENKLFALLCLELWFQRRIDQPDVDRGSA